MKTADQICKSKIPPLLFPTSFTLHFICDLWHTPFNCILMSLTYNELFKLSASQSAILESLRSRNALWEHLTTLTTHTIEIAKSSNHPGISWYTNATYSAVEAHYKMKLIHNCIA